MRDMTTEDRVLEFHTTFSCDINVPMAQDALLLRMDLINEEVDEVDNAMAGVWAALQDGGDIQDAKAHLLKELCDLQYVLDGTFVAFGLPKQAAFNRVHASNMSKLDDAGNVIYREDGKVLKGPNYFEPTLEDLV